MIRALKGLIEFWRILVRRYRTQGLRTTLNWLLTVGTAKLTGRVSLRYSQVVPGLYIGPQFGRRGRPALETAGITASMSLRAEFDDMEHGLAMADHSYLPTEDNTAPSLEQLEEGVRFIQRVISEDGRIYVHCGSGVGRAPTMAAAYLVSEGMTLDEAIAQIQRVRPFVRILPGQMARLREYEAHVHQRE
jgi:hypothetical protein